jgi:general secretion pathway protein I
MRLAWVSYFFSRERKDRYRQISPRPATGIFGISDLEKQRIFIMRRLSCQTGFTLLEVLVALVIVGTALGASLRAVGNLTVNSSALRASAMGAWAAENSLINIRLSKIWPEVGTHTVDCPQDELQLTCEEVVTASGNPNFRRVEVNVFDAQDPARRVAHLVQVVSNGL